MDQIEVIHTRVFAAGRNGGNPCPVVLAADGLSGSQMQALAREFGLDTVFILKPRSQIAAIRLRYFVPEHEMGVSVHATIAAITVAVAQKRLLPERGKVETSCGVFKFAWQQNEDGYLVTLEQKPPVFGPHVSCDEVASVLGITVEDIASNESPIQAVSVSRPKLIIPLNGLPTLNLLAPDLDALWRLCDTHQVSGLYPFTRRLKKDVVDAEARQFPLRAGFPEDAATGVAAAALGAYLAMYDLKGQPGHHEFRIAQGYAMGAPSLIEVIAECGDGTVTRTAIRGVARIIRAEHRALQDHGKAEENQYERSS